MFRLIFPIPKAILIVSPRSIGVFTRPSYGWIRNRGASTLWPLFRNPVAWNWKERINPWASVWGPLCPVFGWSSRDEFFKKKPPPPLTAGTSPLEWRSLYVLWGFVL